MKSSKYILCTVSVLIFLIGCSNNSGNDSRSKGVISLESSVFGENENIPSRFTCDGRDISPPLLWSNLPNGTKSIAIITDDPDAPVGTWVHWVIYNMPIRLINLMKMSLETGNWKMVLYRAEMILER